MIKISLIVIGIAIGVWRGITWINSKSFWFFVHNAIAHPLLCIDNRRASWISRFHDWTGEKMGIPH